MEYEIRVIPKKEISIIEPLWQKLNEIHGCDSVHWKEHFANFTFGKRIQNVMELDESDLRIVIARANNGDAIGYCFATVAGSVGEIESLFVDERFREHGIGKKLVEECILWLRSRECARIRVAVAEGHESVFPFYERLGFRPKTTVLELKK